MRLRCNLVVDFPLHRALTATTGLKNMDNNHNFEGFPGRLDPLKEKYDLEKNILT